nr:FkbM family methyltransferase [uncultured Acetatifactor sp.]
MEYEKLYFHYKSTEEKLVNHIDVQRIYRRLIDKKSKQIFTDRIMFSLTDDWRFIRNLLIKSGNWTQLGEVLSSYKEIYIYGAGIAGSRLPLMFPEYPWKGYIDKNKKGLICNGLPIYGIEKCREFLNESAVLISNMSGADDIKKELLYANINDKNIIMYITYMKNAAKNIYFEDEYLSKEKMVGGVFIDGGAFDGGDTVRFFDWMNEKKNVGAIAFEADSDNYEITKKNLVGYSQVKIYNQGLSDVSEKKRFLSGKGEMSNFSSQGDSVVLLNALDNMIGAEQVSYIKMDVEGFEQKALLGAKRIIEEQFPTLAVSIYHKREDIWKLPELILRINPKYKFFLRHYSLGVVDTVLYAI